MRSKLFLLVIALVCPAGLRAQAEPLDNFSQILSDGVANIIVDFTRVSMRSDNFGVMLQDSAGKFTAFQPGAHRTYFGTCISHPGASALALRKANGTLIWRIIFEDGSNWTSTGSGVVVRKVPTWTPRWPSNALSINGGAGADVRAIEIAIDLSYREFAATNSNAADAIDMAEFSVLSTNAIFLRDCAILHRIGKIVIRTSTVTDPYEAMTANTSNMLLAEASRQWNGPGAVLRSVVGATYQQACVVTPAVQGGLTTIGPFNGNQSTTANGAEANGDFFNVWRHESGHAWGATHEEGGPDQPEGPTIMSGNSMARFSSPDIAAFIAFGNAQLSGITRMGPYPLSLPPRANADRVRLSGQGEPVLVDVIANDSDSNGQPLKLTSPDEQGRFSQLGGSVTLSVGTGPGGRDQILYTPPPFTTTGTDSFFYQIQDPDKRTATGYVVLKPYYDNELVGQWSFDENSGDVTADSSSGQLNGDIQTSKWLENGRFGPGLSFDGESTSAILTPPPDFVSNTITFAGWIRRKGLQVESAGIAVEYVGLTFGANNSLRGIWHADNQRYSLNSTLVPPDDTWTFVALTVSPTKATLYMKPQGGILQKASSPTRDFLPRAFERKIVFGGDYGRNTWRFRGDLDHFLLYKRTLTEPEVGALALGNGPARVLSPSANEEIKAGAAFNLTWAGTGPSTYRVYLGGDFATVRDALPGSPSDLGTFLATSLTNPGLHSGSWFWRVDSTDPQGIVFKGATIPFIATEDPLGMVGWWKMNATSGDLADDSTGRGGHGSVTGGTWTPGRRAGALSFDGSGGVSCGTRASISGPGAFSVGAWVRIPTSHANQAVIVQQRSPNLFNGQYALRVDGDGKPSFWVYGDNAEQFNFKAVSSIKDNQWHHVMAVREGNMGHIYIDGTLSNSASGIARSLNPAIAVFMGYDARDRNRYLTGAIDDVRIFNRALGADEINTLINRAPAFSPASLTFSATEDMGFSGQLSANDLDIRSGEVLNFVKISGPPWLTISPNGLLVGTPVNSNVGPNHFIVRVTDTAGQFAEATLTLTVLNVNDAPVFDAAAARAFQASNGKVVAGESYSAVFSATASDADGDNLTYLKQSGPEWLKVGDSGTLSGTPAITDEGTTAVTILAKDFSGEWAETTFDITVIVRRGLAVGFSNSTEANTAVLATENTNALKAAIAVNGLIVWNNQSIDDAGNGTLANGHGTGTYFGVTVNSFSSVPYQRGSSSLSVSDASQRVFRYYLDDGDSGGYFDGDSIGASIHLTGLGQLLSANRATNYTLTLLFNADSTSGTPFHPATVRDGVPSTPSFTAIRSLPLLGTINPTLLGDGKQPLPSVGTDIGGQRGWGRFTGLTANNLTISLPARSGNTRGSIAGFIITPNTDILPQANAGEQDGYAQWLNSHFGAAEGNPQTAGETADPNADGVQNLLAYAMGIDPLAPAAAGATAAQRGHLELSKGSGTFHFDYQRDLTASGVSLIIEGCADLGNPVAWEPANVVEEIVSEEAGIRTIRATYTPPSGDHRRFFRLRASR
ncbi:Ig-like domain-containing protein [Luteolibacter arcticus]|uniref:Ig-like domain-containing protein n=1 Tax=Luteolibacter arcticus TaxID=1581411 RepID=A0ABT3GNA9_9BACT|nr:LamG-like jellyroll fold domain-containing protein [Luteolibacter arcticus]MCW1925004.1 Ig-like domain-containing protein [Luteolibacter arcticus]